MKVIRSGRAEDFEVLCEIDAHISKNVVIKKLENNGYLILLENDVVIGYLRFGMFWDTYPFMNLLFIVESSRGQGYGRQLVEYWEAQMKESAYEFVMTSTQSDEYAQHFYRKLGYKDVGGFTLPGECLELMMIKNI